MLILLWSPEPVLKSAEGYYFTMSNEAQRELAQHLKVPEEGLVFFCYVREGRSFRALQLEFFNRTYPDSCMTRDIELDEGWVDSLIFFLEKLNLLGVVWGVPLDLVFKNGLLVAVVEGLKDNTDFWSKIAITEPNQQIPLFRGDEVILLRCFQLIGSHACILDEDLTRVKLSLSTLLVALGVSTSITIHANMKNPRDT